VLLEHESSIPVADHDVDKSVASRGQINLSVAIEIGCRQRKTAACA
jgi:hypothetical protein